MPCGNALLGSSLLAAFTPSFNSMPRSAVQTAFCQSAFLPAIIVMVLMGTLAWKGPVRPFSLTG